MGRARITKDSTTHPAMMFSFEQGEWRAALLTSGDLAVVQPVLLQLCHVPAQNHTGRIAAPHLLRLGRVRVQGRHGGAVRSGGFVAQSEPQTAAGASLARQIEPDFSKGEGAGDGKGKRKIQRGIT